MGGRLAERAGCLAASCCPTRSHRSDRAGHDRQQCGRGPPAGRRVGRRIRRQLAARRCHGCAPAPRGCPVRGRGALARSGERIAQHVRSARGQLEGPAGRVAHALLRGLRPDLPTGSLAWTGAGRDQLSARRNHQHHGRRRRWFRTSSGRHGLDRGVVRHRAATAGPAASTVAQRHRPHSRATGQGRTKAAQHAAHDAGLDGRRRRFVWRRIGHTCAVPPIRWPRAPGQTGGHVSSSGRQVGTAPRTSIHRRATGDRVRASGTRCPAAKPAKAGDDRAGSGAGQRLRCSAARRPSSSSAQTGRCSATRACSCPGFCHVADHARRTGCGPTSHEGGRDERCRTSPTCGQRRQVPRPHAHPGNGQCRCAGAGRSSAGGGDGPWNPAGSADSGPCPGAADTTHQVSGRGHRATKHEGRAARQWGAARARGAHAAALSACTRHAGSPGKGLGFERSEAGLGYHRGTEQAWKASPSGGTADRDRRPAQPSSRASERGRGHLSASDFPSGSGRPQRLGRSARKSLHPHRPGPRSRCGGRVLGLLVSALLPPLN